MKRGPYNRLPPPNGEQLAVIKSLWTADNDETLASIAAKVGMPRWRVGDICRANGWERNPVALKRSCRRKLRAALAAAGIVRVIEEPAIERADGLNSDWVAAPPRPWPPHRFTDDPRATAECRRWSGNKAAA